MNRKVAWPSGLRRWFKAPVSSEAWVRIPPLPEMYFNFTSSPLYVTILISYNSKLIRFMQAVIVKCFLVYLLTQAWVTWKFTYAHSFQRVQQKCPWKIRQQFFLSTSKRGSVILPKSTENFGDLFINISDHYVLLCYCKGGCQSNTLGLHFELIC